MSIVPERLKQRNMVQWALAYLAGGWVVLEVADLVGDNFGWPPIVTRGLIIAVVVGLPVTLVLAWYHGEKGRQRVSGVELLILAGLFVLGGGALAVFAPGAPTATTESASESQGLPGRSLAERLAADDRPSLLILPFANRSAREEDRYFAEAMHEEIATRLSRFSGLRTTSGSGVTNTAGEAPTISQIAAREGARYVLEGSVLRAGDRVQLRVRLHDAESDVQLSDRDTTIVLSSATDLLGTLNQITERVASELRVVVGDQEHRRSVLDLTRSREAYDLYIRALDVRRSQPATVERREAVLALVDRALAADPEFASPHSLASRIHTDEYFFGRDRTSTRAELARQARERAVELAPDDPDVRYESHLYFYRVERDYERALEELQASLDVVAGDVRAHWAKALIQRRLGHFEAAVRTLDAGLNIDPRAATLWGEIAVTFAYLGLTEASTRAYETRIELTGRTRGTTARWLSWHRFQLGADAEAYRDWLREAGYTARLAEASYYVNDLEEVERLAREADTPILLESDDYLQPASLWLSRVAWSRGDDEARVRHAHDTIAFLRSLAGRSDEPILLRTLAMAYALAGEEEVAGEVLSRSIELARLDMEHVDRPHFLLVVARIQVILGRPTEAISTIQRILEEPSPFHPPQFEVDPSFAPLWDIPAFRELMDAHRL